MIKKGLFIGVLIMTAACSQQQAAKTPLTGSDRDANGCIASAGYQWCAYTEQCQRSWELADQQGFAATAEAFERYCSQ